MSKYLSGKPNLAIISDTLMYRSNGIYVFEPVLREVDSFSDLFSTIRWLGFGHQKNPPKNTKKEIPVNLKLLSVRPSGGNSILKKVAILFFIPYYIFKIIQLLNKSDIIHTRGPSIPALLTIIISFFYPSKNYWHKYAGNWQIESKTISYRFQKWLLKKKIPGKVFVVRRNNLDPKHILSCVNPCLTNKEIKLNIKFGLRKKFNDKLIFCFVGRLEKSKGFLALLKAVKSLHNIKWIEKLHCVGEITEGNYIEGMNSNGKITIKYHGVLDRKGLNKIYKDSHFIILPSESEGFPKVLAEASSYGCIPIIPPISAILSNINKEKKNGIVLEDINSQGIVRTIESLQKIKSQLSEYSINAMQELEKYSYEKYNHIILNEIIQN